MLFMTRFLLMVKAKDTCCTVGITQVIIQKIKNLSDSIRLNELIGHVDAGIVFRS